MKNIYLICFIFATVLFISGCGPKEIGKTCDIDDECITKNCANSICSRNELNGYCREDYHCNQGVCKSNICSLGDKGDTCISNEDCDQSKLECINARCVSNTWYCSMARKMNIAGGSILAAIIFLLIGVAGVYFGFQIMGGNIVIGGITIAFSIFVLAVALGIFGIGVLAACL